MRNIVVLAGLTFGALAAAVIVADADSSTRLVSPTVQEIVAAREAAMMMSGSVHGLARIRMDEGAEAKKVAYAADGLASWAKAIPGMFPAGTGPDVVETYAKPEVWTDRAGFLKAAKNYIAETAKLSALAHANDTEAFKAQLAVVGDSCKSCHDLYQKKIP